MVMRVFFQYLPWSAGRRIALVAGMMKVFQLNQSSFHQCPQAVIDLAQTDTIFLCQFALAKIGVGVQRFKQWQVFFSKHDRYM